MRQDFYPEVISQLRGTGVLDPGMSILVVCGGRTDRTVLRRCGFRDVVISNIDPDAKPGDFAPYQWSYQDAERLSYDDETFDFCLVHSGLHHCYSPHRALLEMYRVARTGLLLFEPYDNLTTRIGVRLRLSQVYEHAGVCSNDCDHGGAANTPIPNFVYRWTEQEIVKTINSYAPYARHHIRFIHRMRVPWGQLRRRRNRTAYRLVRLGQPALRLLEWAAPKQSNNFAALVLKPRLPQDLHPWLSQESGEIVLNPSWLTTRYKP